MDGAGAALSGVKLSIDARTLDAALGRGHLASIEPDGSLVYEEGKTPQVKLTEQLARIWDEIPNGLLDINEAKLASLPPDELVVPATAGAKETEVAEKGGDPRNLDTEGMAQMRIDLSTHLNEARNELWFALELAKTLALSSGSTIEPPASAVPGQPGHQAHRKPRPKTKSQMMSHNLNHPHSNSNGDGESTKPSTGLANDAPPILPPSTYSATPARPTPLPDHVRVQGLEFALAAKQQALDECSAMIDAAVEELQLMADAGDRFWASVRQLKNGEGEGGKGQWAVVPKPDFARSMAEGEKARDVIIPYAVDEAPWPLRARSLAAFDLDPNKKDALTFGARGYHRLRLTLASTMGSESSALISAASGESIGASMAAAQLEAFDEEIFGEIRREAIKLAFATVESSTISMPVGDMEMVFDMYDTRKPPAQSSGSDLCDVILLSTRLLLLQLHRHRKHRLLGAVPPATPVPSVLTPILHVMNYRHLVQRIRGTFSMFSMALNKAGLVAVVTSRLVVGDEVGIKTLSDIVEGTGRIEDLGGIISLDVQEFRNISVNTTAPSSTIITTSQATFPLSDIEELPTIVSFDIALQLLSYARDDICRDDDHPRLAEQVFVDEMGGLVRLGSLGDLHVAFPAPYDGIYARLERDDGDVEAWNSREGPGLAQWLHDLAARIEE